MNTLDNRSEALLNKVYDHLDSIDVTKLSMRELQDFLEVVQKGRFLETIGQPAPWLTGYCAAPATPAANTATAKGNERKE